MFSLEISSVPVILPTLESVLHSDFKGIQWIMNAYTIACVSVLMATGTLADRFGRKRVFLISIALFALSSLLCGLAWNTPMLIASRVFQGASGGAMLGAFFILTDPVSGATTARGKLLFAAGAGVLTWVIRSFGAYPDGVAFATLLMNILVPLIDMKTQAPVFGHKKD